MRQGSFYKIEKSQVTLVAPLKRKSVHTYKLIKHIYKFIERKYKFMKRIDKYNI